MARATQHRCRRRRSHPNEDDDRKDLEHQRCGAVGRPGPPHDDRLCQQRHRTDHRQRRGKRQACSLHEELAEPRVVLSRVVVHHDREEHLVQLIREPENHVGQPLGNRPDGYRAGRQNGRDDHRVRHVVHLVRRVLDQHVHAEPGHLPQAGQTEQRRANLQQGINTVGVVPVRQVAEHPGRGHSADQLYESAPGKQDPDVHCRNRQRHDRAHHAVEEGPLEAIDDGAIDREGETCGELHRDQLQDEPAGARLRCVEVEERPQIPRDDDHDAEGDHAYGCEDEHQRAGKLADGRSLPARPVLRDEPFHGAAVPEVQHGEVGNHRRCQHPQPVVGGSQVPHVDGEHHEAEQDLDRQRDVAAGHVQGDGAALVGLLPDHLGRGHVRHLAPLAKSTTFTVSKRIVRSNVSDRCLT